MPSLMDHVLFGEPRGVNCVLLVMMSDLLLEIK